MRRGPKLDNRMIIGGVIALIIVVGALAAFGGGGGLFGTAGEGDQNTEENNGNGNGNGGGNEQPQEQPQQPQEQPQQPQEQPQQPQEQPQEQPQQPQEQPQEQVQPTAVPVQPTAVPVQPTAVPVQPTDVPVQPTDVPPTAVVVQPTTAQQILAEPTATATRRNTNQDGTRPDRSSLGVSASCDGGNAVFSISNHGVAGQGDMVSATSYVIKNDLTGAQLSSGSIQLRGGASMTVNYASNGVKVRLIANQQTGHPGAGLAQAETTCGGGGGGQAQSVPTTAPTTVPTNVPAIVPTTVPTNVPTTVPTNVPATLVPTEAPQIAVVPTEVPTQSEQNVQAPTVEPTQRGGRGNQNNSSSERLTICHVTPAQTIILDNMPRSSLNGHFDNNGNLHGSDFLITSDADRERCVGTETPSEEPAEPSEPEDNNRVSICHVTPSQGILLENMPRQSLNGHFDNNGNLHGSDFLVSSDEDRARCEGSSTPNEPSEPEDNSRVSICHVTPSQGILLENMPRQSLNGHFDNNGNLHGSDFLVSSDEDRARCEGSSTPNEPEEPAEPSEEATPEEPSEPSEPEDNNNNRDRVSICHVTPAQGIVLDNMPRQSLNGHFDNNGNLHGSDFLISSDADRERCENTGREPEEPSEPEDNSRVTICHVNPSHGIVLENMPRSSLNGHFDNNGNLHGDDFLISSDEDRARCEGTTEEPEEPSEPEDNSRVSICHVTPAQGIVLDNMPRQSLNGHFDNNGNLHGDDFLINNEEDRARCVGTPEEPEEPSEPEDNSRVSICHVTPAQGIVLDNMPRQSLNGHFDNNGNLHVNDFLITSDADRERCEGIAPTPEPQETPEERLSICHVNPARSIVLEDMPRSSLNGHMSRNGNLHGDDFLITSDEDRARCEGTETPPDPELPPAPSIALLCVVTEEGYSVQVVDGTEVANSLASNPNSYIMGENDTCEAPPAPPVPPVVVAVCVVSDGNYSVQTVEANDAVALVNANAGSYIVTDESPSCEEVVVPPPPVVAAVCQVTDEGFSVVVVDGSELEDFLAENPNSYLITDENPSCEAPVLPPPPVIAAVCVVEEGSYSVLVVDGSELEDYLANNPNASLMGENDTCEAPPVPPVLVPVCQVDGENYSVTTVEINDVANLLVEYPSSFVLEEALTCEPPAPPPAEIAICRVDGETYSVEVLEASEAEAVLAESVNSYAITENSPACEPPTIFVPVCVVDANGYRIEVVDAVRVDEIVSSNMGSYVVSDESPACEPPVPVLPPAPIAMLAQVCRIDGNSYNVVEIFVSGYEGDDLGSLINSEIASIQEEYPDSFQILSEADAVSCVPPVLPPPPAIAQVCKVDDGSYTIETIEAESLNSTLADFPGSFVMAETSTCELPPVEPPAEVERYDLCVVDGEEAYGLIDLSVEERDNLLANYPSSRDIDNDDFSECLPPVSPAPSVAQICRVDGNRYTVEVVDSEALDRILAAYPGSFVLGDAANAANCKRPERPVQPPPTNTTPNEPEEPAPTEAPVVSEPEEALAGWTPIEVGAAVCEDWVLYHTNETGDWEIFRLGELPDGQTGDRNLSQGEDATDLAPVRSPDNQWIAFVSDRDGNWEIYVGAVDGGQQIRVTYNEATDLDPVWSPDGTKLAYETNMNGNWEIRLFDLITGQSTRLTNNAAEDINPYWNIDGKTLAFQSDRDGMEQIYLLDIASQAISKLSDGSANDLDPQFSNDGTMLLFRSDRNGASLEATNVFYMMADGTEIKQVSANGGNAMNAVWSPQDELIAYQSDVNAGVNDIYVYELSTEETRLVTNNDGDNQAIEDISPTWICESTTLVFASEAEGDYDIFFVPAEPITNDAVEMVLETAQTVDPDEAAPFTDVDPENSPAEENASRNDALLPSTNGN